MAKVGHAGLWSLAAQLSPTVLRVDTQHPLGPDTVKVFVFFSAGKSGQCYSGIRRAKCGKLPFPWSHTKEIALYLVLQ